MSVITLIGAKPSPRADQPWTQARIEQAPTVDGSWTAIDTLALDPLDSDPLHPQARTLTSENATSDGAYYRVVFLDADGDEDQATDPVARAEPPAALWPPSLSLDEFKRRGDIIGMLDGDPDDEMLSSFLAAAFEQAQAPPPLGCGRTLWPDPAADGDDPVDRTFTIGPGSVTRTVLIPDARQITAVTIDGTATTSYTPISRNGHIVALTLPAVAGTDATDATRQVVVTGRFGFSDIPVSLREAVYMLAARLYYERSAQYADQVAIAEGTAVQSYYRQLPPRVKLAFASFAPPAQNVRLA